MKSTESNWSLGTAFVTLGLSHVVGVLKKSLTLHSWLRPVLQNELSQSLDRFLPFSLRYQEDGVVSRSPVAARSRHHMLTMSLRGRMLYRVRTLLTAYKANCGYGVGAVGPASRESAATGVRMSR